MGIYTSSTTLLAIGLLISATGNVMGDPGLLGASCGNPFNNGTVGPYDYENPSDQIQRIPFVETNHFNPDVENLVRGQSSAYIMGDLDFVLRAVPNHHGALVSLMRYDSKRVAAERKYFSTECYFQRAVTFRPDDAAAHVLYGIYLVRIGKMSEAKDEYLIALELQPDYAEAHYNLGLLYVKQKEFELAVQSARKAYDLGFPLQGLRRQLDRAGAWTE